MEKSAAAGPVSPFGKKSISIGVATNEPRSKPLIEALEQQCLVQGVWDFDDIDFFTKAAAAALSFNRVKAEWWGGYQMHPLVQRRRRLVLRRLIEKERRPIDALLCWGSWFHPFGKQKSAPPFFNYIDQSRSLKALEGETPASGRGRRRSHALQAQTYAASSGVLCMSEWAKAQTIEAHPQISDKVHVVGWGPCGVDLSDELPGPKTENVVLHVSNDFRRKGVDFLIATAEEVAAVIPDVQFLVVGRDRRATWAVDTGHVRFTGPAYGEDLRKLFRRAKVFFLPHRFDRSPHVLVEAMSASLPLVVSAQGGPVELFSGDPIGYCVPIGDISGYAQALCSLLKDESRRSEYAESARKLMQQKYNWPVVADRILRIMSDSLSRSD